MDLDDIMLSEIREIQIPYDFTYVEYKEQNNWANRNIFIDTENKLMVAIGKGLKGLGEKRWRD